MLLFRAVARQGVCARLQLFVWTQVIIGKAPTPLLCGSSRPVMPRRA